MKIFIYMPNWLGDAAMAIAALNLLAQKFETARLVIYASKAAAALCEGYGEIIIEKKGDRFKQFLNLREHKFDIAINLKASISSRFLCSILRAKKRIFFFAKKHEQIHQVAKYARTLAPLGVEFNRVSKCSPARFFYIKSCISAPDKVNKKILDLFINKKADSRISFLDLMKNKFPRLKSRNMLAIACGAAYGSAKCYDDFASLAKLLAPYFRQILLLGSAAEMQNAQFLEDELKEHAKVKNLCCKTDIKRLSAALCNCDLVLANDSGIMHLCAMLDVPCAVVFGATNPAQTAAYSNKAMIFSTLSACSSCKKRECDKDEHLCMKYCHAQEIFMQIKNTLDLKLIKRLKS